MKSLFLIVFLALACSDNKPTEPTTNNPPDEPDAGITRTFTVPDSQQPCGNRRCSQSDADFFCIGLGYDYAENFSCGGYNCVLLLDVTCFKR